MSDKGPEWWQSSLQQSIHKSSEKCETLFSFHQKNINLVGMKLLGGGLRHGVVEYYFDFFFSENIMCVFTQTLLYKQDVIQDNFTRSTAGLNSEFSVFFNACLVEGKEHSRSYDLRIV